MTGYSVGTVARAAGLMPVQLALLELWDVFPRADGAPWGYTREDIDRAALAGALRKAGCADDLLLDGIALAAGAGDSVRLAVLPGSRGVVLLGEGEALPARAAVVRVGEVYARVADALRKLDGAAANDDAEGGVVPA